MPTPNTPPFSNSRISFMVATSDVLPPGTKVEIERTLGNRIGWIGYHRGEAWVYITPDLSPVNRAYRNSIRSWRRFNTTVGRFVP